MYWPNPVHKQKVNNRKCSSSEGAKKVSFSAPFLFFNTLFLTDFFFLFFFPSVTKQTCLCQNISLNSSVLFFSTCALVRSRQSLLLLHSLSLHPSLLFGFTDKGSTSKHRFACFRDHTSVHVRLSILTNFCTCPVSIWWTVLDTLFYSVSQGT